MDNSHDSNKPVAWLHTKIEGVAVPHRPADLDKHPDRWTALYPEPKPCPTCEALARTVMMDQTAHERKPLSDEEIKRMAAKWFLSMYWPLCNTFARAIEAAHGIKGGRMTKVTREMIAAAHDVTMRHKIVLGYELLTEIYQAMDAKREFVGLTDDEFEDIELGCRSTPFGKIEAMRKVEAKLREKNS